MSSEKKKPEITQEQGFRIGLSANEWKSILSFLGRGPTEHEAIVLRAIWSESVSRTLSGNLLRFLVTGSSEKFPESSRFRAYNRSGSISLSEGIDVVVSCYAQVDAVLRHLQLGSQSNLETVLSEQWARGSKPLAALAAHRLGPITNVENVKDFGKCVEGAAVYLNRVGVPFVAEDFFFHQRFQHRLVANTFSIGFAEREKTLWGGRREAAPVNKANLMLVYLGVETGEKKTKAAAGAAAMERVVITPWESLERGGSSLENRLPIKAVDPTLAIRLGNVAIEAHEAGLVFAGIPLTDFGITAAVFRLARAFNVAIDLDLDRVPVVRQDVTARELLLAEKPGRFLFMVPREAYKDLQPILEKWKIGATVIGNTTDGYGLKFSWRHNEIVDLPLQRVLEATTCREYHVLSRPPMIKETPRHRVEEDLLDRASEIVVQGSNPPGYGTSTHIQPVEGDASASSQNDNDKLEEPVYLNDSWMDLLGNPAFAQRKQFFEKFDFARGSALFSSSQRALMLRFPKANDPKANEKPVSKKKASAKGKSATSLPSEKLISVSLVSKVLFVQNDTYLGAAHTIAEAVRDLACLGVKPLGLALSINFGNPRRYKELCDIAEILRGIGDASKFFDIEVVACDVSTAQTQEGQRTLPSFTVLMIGEAGDRSQLVPAAFVNDGDTIIVLGDTYPDISVSEYAFYCHHLVRGSVPNLDFETEKKTSELVRELVQSGLVRSASSVGAGGLAVALAEQCLNANPPQGATLEVNTRMNARDFRRDAVMFSESASRFLISCDPQNREKILQLCRQRDVFIGGEGVVGGRNIAFAGLVECSITLPTAYKVWGQGIGLLFGSDED